MGSAHGDLSLRFSVYVARPAEARSLTVAVLNPAGIAGATISAPAADAVNR
jgi:hypothetical protein